MPPKTYSIALSKVDQVNSTFKRLNTTQQAFADFQESARSTFSNFLQGKPVESGLFVKFCQALGFDNWQDMAGLYEPPSVYPSHNLRRSGAEQFIGREEEIISLHQMLCSDNKASISQISGMPGSGKTELALQYSYQHVTQNSAYPGGIFFIEARGSKEQTGLDIIKNVEDNFGLKVVTTIGRKKLTLSERVQWCWNNWILKEQTLIIFDDVPAFINIEEYLPLVLTNFKVLLTTRINFLAVNIQVLSLSTLKPAKSLELLIVLSRRLVQEGLEVTNLEELENAKNLCSWLGHLPLGLELVGTYMRIHADLSFTQMLKDLNNQRIEQESLQEKYDGMTASLNLIAAFELSWKDLGELPKKIAYCVGLLAPHSFHWGVVEECVCSNGLLSNEQEKIILINLRDKYLVNSNLIKRVQDEVYQVHELLREFYKYKLKSYPLLEEQLQSSFYNIYSVFSYGVSGSQSFNYYDNSHTFLLPQLEEISSSLTQENFDNAQKSKHFGSIFIGLSNIYNLIGKYDKSEQYLKKYLSLVSHIDNSFNVHVVRAYFHLGLLYKIKGSFYDALDFFTQAFQTVQRTYTISVSPELKNKIIAANEEEMKSIFSELLKAGKGGFVADFDGMCSYGMNIEIDINIGSLFFLLGIMQEAEKVYLRILPMLDIAEELTSGSDPSSFNLYSHLSTVDIATGLARLYLKQNKFEEAHTLLLRGGALLASFSSTELIVDKKIDIEIGNLKLSGFPVRDVPQIIESYTNLIDTLGDHDKYLKKYSDAIFLYEYSQAIRRREKMVLGVASSYFNMASVLIAQDLIQGEFNLDSLTEPLRLNAKNLLTDALSIRIELLGHRHYLTGLTMLYLGQAYELEGNIEKAKLNFSEGIQIMKLNFSEDHYVVRGWLQKMTSLKYWDCL